LLPEIFRLKKNNDFRKIYRYGRSIANSYLVLYYFPRSPREPLTEPRIGFSISKKLGSAVQRNQIKRRLREAIKPYLTLIKPNYDLVFIARFKIKGIPFNYVEKNMGALLQKAHLLENGK